MEEKIFSCGILCIDIKFDYKEKFGAEYTSYIALSYAKYLENCKIIPIWIGKSIEYYRDILSKVNGILIPGGAVWFNDEKNGKCVQSTKFIYKIAKEMNSSGIYFPIWGTCLGFQMILYAAACDNCDGKVNCNEIRVNHCTPLYDKKMPIILEPDFTESKLFSRLTEDLSEIMRTQDIGYHYHRFYVTKQILDKFKLTDEWKATSNNLDNEGEEFISTIEHKSFPFYGSQFHPEKFPHEVKDSSDAQIRASKYFSEFFIIEIKKNLNNFGNDLNCYLIDNFNCDLKETGNLNENKSKFSYLFKDDSDYLRTNKN